MKECISSEYIQSIFNTIGITFMVEEDVIKVKKGKIEILGPHHSKVIKQLYLEMMEMGRRPYYIVVGAITYPLRNSEVLDMTLVNEFTSSKGKLQIWINNEYLNNIKIIIPSQNENLTVSLVQKNNKKETDYLKYLSV